jgi:hypothetical protein
MPLSYRRSIIVTDLIEIILGCAAQGAYPIGRQVFKIGSLLDSVLGITDLGTVLITAQLASIYAHSYPSFHMMFVFFRKAFASLSECP